MKSEATIIVTFRKNKFMYFFRVKLGRTEMRSQLYYTSAKQCKKAIKNLCEDLGLTYEEEK